MGNVKQIETCIAQTKVANESTATYIMIGIVLKNFAHVNASLGSFAYCRGAQLQWVETNQSNFRIFPMDICLSPPRGTTLTAFPDVRMSNTDVAGC
jgi:hypothetical protein